MNECLKHIEKCKARCCGIVPFCKKDYERLKKRRQRRVLFRMSISENLMIPITYPTAILLVLKGRFFKLYLDLVRCCFLTKGNKCAIYEERPKVCRLYGEIKEMPCVFLKNKKKRKKKGGKRT